MKLVVDASVGLKWVLPEADSGRASRLRDEFRYQTRELIAPDIFPIECGHSLSKKQRQGLISNAMTLWDQLILDAPVLHPSLPLMSRALEIALRAKIGVHDCLYVALAEREGCGLVTSDEKLIKNLQADFPFIVLLSAL